MSGRWKTWWLIFASLIGLGIALSLLLVAQGTKTAGVVTGGIFAAAAVLWLVYGLWQGKSRRWVKWLSTILAGTSIVGFSAWGFYAQGYPAVAVGLAGVWGLGLVFVLGIPAVKVFFVMSGPVSGVARTLIDEALHLKIVWALGGAMALLIPVFPLLLNPNELLNYRIKTFLSWSLSSVEMLVCVMTVCLSAWSICREIQGRQIFLTMSKPVGAWQYLLGKWLGMAVLNLCLLTGAGGGIYVFAKVLQSQPARDALDRVAVDEQVLTARMNNLPYLPDGIDYQRLFDERVKQLRRENPEHFGTDDKPKTLSDADEKAVRIYVWTRWHTVPAGGRNVYLFAGLEEVKKNSDRMQLRLRPRASKAPEDGQVRLAFLLNGRPWPEAEDGLPAVMTMAHDQYVVLNLPTAGIDEKGRLELSIVNVTITNPQDQTNHGPSVSFTPGEGLELFYREGGFEGNLLRSLLTVWMQTLFLSSLALAAGSFLGFPVACLMCMLVLVVGTSSVYLQDAVKAYGAGNGMQDQLGWWEYVAWYPHVFWQRLMEGEVSKAWRIVVQLFGQLVLLAMPSLSQFSTTDLVADGKMVSWAMLGKAAGFLGFSGVAATGGVGWWIFRKRELATITA